METGALGKGYRDGEVIVRQGESGDCMYVIQSGRAEVFQVKGGREIRLAVLGKEDVFGEMAIFEKETRSATVRALGDVRVLTIDKKTFLRRIHEDPSLAFRILQKMSHRIREMDAELVRTRTGKWTQDYGSS
jgi:CRP/FNR family transcriptional regulator